MTFLSSPAPSRLVHDGTTAATPHTEPAQKNVTQEPPKKPPGETRAAVMRRVAKRDTAPELGLRRALHRLGLRYRLYFPVPGAPRRSIDVALTKARIAVFVDGCFWHGCGLHFHLPQHNRDWWTWKLGTIQFRDQQTDDMLAARGWLSVRVWEHDDMDDAALRVAALWRERR